MFGVFSRYPAFGFLSSSSRLFLMNALNAPYDFFCMGTFCDELTLGSLWFLLVFGVFSRYPACGFLSFASRLL